MIYIREHRVGPRGCRTYRTTDAAWTATEALPQLYRREAYFTWEMSADLRDAAGSVTALHPHDWDRQAAAHWPGHPSIDAVLASRGYGEDGSTLS